MGRDDIDPMLSAAIRQSARPWPRSHENTKKN